MSPERTESWDWSQLDPMTKSVVAAFSWRIGNDEGCLSDQAFIGSTTEAFESMTTEDIVRTVQCTGRTGLRNMIIGRLSGADGESVRRMTEQIGELAGGSDTSRLLAKFACQQLTGKLNSSYDAIPTLSVLSEMATARIS